MGEVDEKAMTGWQSATDALASWFNSDKKFDELPEEVQTRLSRGLIPLLWDQSSPPQRRNMARQWDCQNHPSLAHAHEAVWERMEALNDCERTASRVALEDRLRPEVTSHRLEQIGLQKDVAAADFALQQATNRLGLGFKPASIHQIIETIREVYAYASQRKMLAPNIKILVPMVQEILGYGGYTASEKPIKDAGNVEEFKKCRAKQGVRNNGSFLPFSLENWNKTGS